MVLVAQLVRALGCGPSGCRFDPGRAPSLSEGLGPLSGPPHDRFMYYVYILFSEKDGKLYTGFTPDLKERIKKHNSGYVLATKNRRPLKLIYYESYTENLDTKRREQFLKGGKGREELKVQLKKCLEKLKYKYR